MQSLTRFLRRQSSSVSPGTATRSSASAAELAVVEDSTALNVSKDEKRRRFGSLGRSHSRERESREKDEKSTKISLNFTSRTSGSTSPRSHVSPRPPLPFLPSRSPRAPLNLPNPPNSNLNSGFPAVCISDFSTGDFSMKQGDEMTVISAKAHEGFYSVRTREGKVIQCPSGTLLIVSSAPQLPELPQDSIVQLNSSTEQAAELPELPIVPILVSSPAIGSPGPSPTPSPRLDLAKELNEKKKPSPDDPPVPLPPLWERRWEPKKKKWFFIDHTTRTTHWTAPEVPEDPVDEQAEDAEEKPEEILQKAPEKCDENDLETQYPTVEGFNNVLLPHLSSPQLSEHQKRRNSDPNASISIANAIESSKSSRENSPRSSVQLGGSRRHSRELRELSLLELHKSDDKEESPRSPRSPPHTPRKAAALLGLDM